MEPSDRPHQSAAEIAVPAIEDPRIYLAAERTFLAWIRTGLALMGFGFILARFGLFLRQIHALSSSGPMPSTGFSLWLGVALVVIGVLVNAAAIWHHLRLIRSFHTGHLEFNRASALAITVAAVLVCIGLVVAAYLIYVQIDSSSPLPEIHTPSTTHGPSGQSGPSNHSVDQRAVPATHEAE